MNINSLLADIVLKKISLTRWYEQQKLARVVQFLGHVYLVFPLILQPQIYCLLNTKLAYTMGGSSNNIPVLIKH